LTLATSAPPDDSTVLGAYVADIRALARLGSGDFAGALTALEEGIALFLDVGSRDGAGYLYNVRGVVRLHLDDLAGAEEELRKAAKLGADDCIDRLEGISMTNLAWTMLRASRWPDALEAAERGATRLASNRVAAAVTGRTLADLLSTQVNDVGTVRAALKQAVAGSRGNPDIYEPPDHVLAALAGALAQGFGSGGREVG